MLTLSKNFTLLTNMAVMKVVFLNQKTKGIGTFRRGSFTVPSLQSFFSIICQPAPHLEIFKADFSSPSRVTPTFSRTHSLLSVYFSPSFLEPFLGAHML